MGRGTNYRRDQQKLRSWGAMEKRVRDRENIMVSSGRGRYPECLEDDPRPYPEVCPKEVPDNLNEVPKECKFCPQYLESPLYTKKTRERLLKRLQESGLPTKIETKQRD